MTRRRLVAQQRFVGFHQLGPRRHPDLPGQRPSDSLERPQALGSAARGDRHAARATNAAPATARRRPAPPAPGSRRAAYLPRAPPPIALRPTSGAAPRAPPRGRGPAASAAARRVAHRRTRPQHLVPARRATHQRARRLTRRLFEAFDVDLDAVAEPIARADRLDPARPELATQSKHVALDRLLRRPRHPRRPQCLSQGVDGDRRWPANGESGEQPTLHRRPDGGHRSRRIEFTSSTPTVVGRDFGCDPTDATRYAGTFRNVRTLTGDFSGTTYQVGAAAPLSDGTYLGLAVVQFTGTVGGCGSGPW